MPTRTSALAVLVLTLASAVPGWADGVFVWKNEQVDIREPTQKALICHFDGVEDLVLEVKFEGAAEEFGWIVPLPAVPEITPEDASIFRELSNVTDGPGYGGSPEIKMLEMTLGGGDEVQVLETKRVGIFDTTVLQAEKGESLQAWLDENGFRMPESGAPVLHRYAERGWVFVAMKITPSERTAETRTAMQDGTLQPLRFRFESEAPVFPLEISSIHGGESEALIYLASPVPMVPEVDGGGEEPWASSLFTNPDLPGIPFERSVRIALEEAMAAEAGELEDREALLHSVMKSMESSVLRLLVREPAPCLGKYRATLTADRMKDVTFVPLDPAKALKSGSEQRRKETLSYLGFHPTETGARVLREHLREEQPTEKALAVWALGQIEKAGAKGLLLRFTEDADPATRLEALAALARQPTSGTIPLLLRTLDVPEQPASRTPEARDAHEWDRFCAGAVWRGLGESAADLDASVLREYATETGGFRQWAEAGKAEKKSAPFGGGRGRASGALAVLLLMMQGDGEAEEAVVEAVVEGGSAARHERLADDTPSGVSWTGFPRGFWTGHAVARHGGIPEWPSLDFVLDLLGNRPQERDSLFRMAVRHPDIPDAAAIVLLARTEALTPEDRDRLFEIWDRAIAGPPLTLDFEKAVGEATVTVDHRSATVAMAFARHDDVEAIERLGRSIPETDTIVEGDLAYAMASTSDSRFYERVLAYSREQWDRVVRSDAVRRQVEQRIRDLTGEHRWRAASGLSDLDLSYRSTLIRHYLLTESEKREDLGVLFRDSETHLFLRLHWILEIAGWDSADTLPADERESRASAKRAALEEAAAILERLDAAQKDPGSLEGRFVTAVGSRVQRRLEGK